MIADKVVAGVASYIETAAHADLSTLTFFERDEGADLTYPACIIREDGLPEEHGVIKGQWTVGVEVIIRTRPEDDSTATTHRAMTAAMNGLIGDSPALVASLGGNLEVHDSWGGQGATEADDGYRSTPFNLEIKAAELA